VFESLPHYVGELARERLASETQPGMPAGELSMTMLASPLGWVSAYSMATPHEFPKRCRRSSPSQWRTHSSSSTKSSTVHIA
jgi:hypothetical protein